MPDDFRLRKIALAAFGPSVLFGVAEGAVLPVVALSAIHDGASLSLASLVVSMIGIGSLISNIPAGELTTRFGERRAMVGAAVVSMSGLVLCVLGLNLLLFALGVLLIGGASSVYNLARQSYLTDAVPLHMRARALSTLGGSMRIGVFVGPFLSAAAIQLLGLDGAYYVAIVATVAAGVLALRVPHSGLTVHASAPVEKLSTLRMLANYRRVFATLGVAIILLSAIRATRQVVIPLWAVQIGLSPTAASIIYGLAGAIDVLTFYPAGKVMDRWGRRWVSVPSTLVLATAILLIPLTTAAIPLALVSMLMGFGNGIGAGLVMTLGADAAPAAGRARFFGIWRELQDTGTGIGPVVLSFVTAIASLSIGILVSGAVGLLAAGALWRWTPRRHNPSAASAR